jgi:DNA mismatch repair ATPase MutS
MTDNNSPAPISLLWPNDVSSDAAPQSNLAADLNLRPLLRAIALTPQYEDHTRNLLLTLTTDPDTIAYRQAILADLRRTPSLVAQFTESLEAIQTLEAYLTAPQWNTNRLRQVAWRLSELERYVDAVVALDAILQSAGDVLQSDGLNHLRRHMHQMITGSLFRQLQTELPALTEQIRGIRSITIGINLDAEMRPISATLLEANTSPIEDESMFSRIFGFGRSESVRSESGQLHDARFIAGIDESHIELDDRNSPFMPQLFKDLSDLLDATCQPIIQALQKYTQINTRFLIALQQDIAFYLGAVAFCEHLQKAGLPLAEPEILPVAAREAHIDGLYNINLGLQYARSNQQRTADIVGNNLDFDADGRIFILTGPNQGGKTTYTQAAGLAQLLFQVGLPVPATHARLSPVDGIYTHFAVEERPNQEAGRLGEEARRLNRIFQHATRHSLVLLNESLASTSASESLYLAQDVVRALRLLGVRAIFATHLHDLAASADEMNTNTPGDSRIISVVSQVKIDDTSDDTSITRTYVIEPGPPHSKSYAIELAGQYGIGFDQLRRKLSERDVLSDNT